MFSFRATLPLQTIYMVMVSIGGLLLLTACTIEHISSRHSADAQASLDLFKTHVHPLLTEMKCAGCHTSKGNGEFADEDIEIAHTAALAESRVDFSDIKNSLLVTRQVPSNHNCDKTSGECDKNAEKLIAALIKWQESRDSDAGKSLLLTDEKDADQGETGDYTDHKLQFAIDKLMNSNASGNVTLEVTASKSSSANLLTLKNFKLNTTADHIFLGGFRAKRNGKYSSDLSKMRVCTLAKPSSEKKTTEFSKIEISFSLEDGDSSPNMIAFGLKDLRVATSDDECEGESIDGDDLGEARTVFNDKEQDIGQIISSNCTTSCHNQISRQGSDLSTFDDFYAARQEIIRRVDCSLQAYANKCMPKPQRNNLQEEQKIELLDWLEALPE